MVRQILKPNASEIVRDYQSELGYSTNHSFVDATDHDFESLSLARYNLEDPATIVYFFGEERAQEMFEISKERTGELALGLANGTVPIKKFPQNDTMVMFGVPEITAETREKRGHLPRVEFEPRRQQVAKIN